MERSKPFVENATSAINGLTHALKENTTYILAQVDSASTAAQDNLTREFANAEAAAQQTVTSAVNATIQAYYEVVDLWPKRLPVPGTQVGGPASQTLDSSWDRVGKGPPALHPEDTFSGLSSRIGPDDASPAPLTDVTDKIVDNLAQASGETAALAPAEPKPASPMAEEPTNPAAVDEAPVGEGAAPASWSYLESASKPGPTSSDAGPGPKPLAASIVPLTGGPADAFIVPAIVAGGVATLLLLNSRAGVSLWSLLRRILGGSGLLRLFSRKIGDEVLRHPVRAAVYEAVTARPGISVSELARETSVRRSTLRHHLKVMVREKHVRIHPQGKTRHVYPLGHGLRPGDIESLTCLARRHREDVARAITASPGCYQKQVAVRAQLPSSRVHEYAGELVAAGLVREARAGRFRVYFPTEKLQTLLRAAANPPSTA